VQKNKQNKTTTTKKQYCDNRNLKRSGKKTTYLIPTPVPHLVINISSFIMTLLTDSVTL